LLAREGAKVTLLDAMKEWAEATKAIEISRLSAPAQPLCGAPLGATNVFGHRLHF
jgi:hypothetical protein